MSSPYDWIENPHPYKRKVPNEARGWDKVDFIDERGIIYEDVSVILAFIGYSIVKKYRKSIASYQNEFNFEESK